MKYIIVGGPHCQDICRCDKKSSHHGKRDDMP